MNLAVLMACATCGYGLTESRDGEQVTYQHPVSESDRHRPVAVPAGLVKNLFHRCHICSGPQPVWDYRTAEIEAEAFGGTREVIQTYNTQWHVCYGCAQFIEADDKWAELHWMQPFDLAGSAWRYRDSPTVGHGLGYAAEARVTGASMLR